ncbi:hypothetical protein [Ochrovirga pacifica]|uniref:hypothetical protein n=1 Tax=Ochrovirga pacifica TaxID=1042376 RepID=UPI0002558797|nr:hypothetical protein [Ochrovirga pacifica]
MKKTIYYLFALTVLLSSLVACGSDDPVQEIETPAEVGLLSFGFYAEDNAENLFTDYAIENVTTTDVSIALPNETDLTSLVARFTTTDGDVVKVGATVLTSGTTARDYSAPVELLITEGTTNKIYTITVGKLASAVWSLSSVYADDIAAEVSLQINPATSLPYVAYISERESSDDQKMNLINYNGTAWNRVGGTDFSDFRANTVDLKFSNSGTPYISFQEYTENREASIMSYQNNSWSYVGGAPFSGLRTASNTVVVTEDDKVFGFFISDDRNADGRRSIFAKSYESGTWSDLSIPGREGFARLIKTKVIENTVYLAVLDYGSQQSVSVYKYENNVWTTLADKMKESEENTIYFYNLDLDVDTEGNVYVAYAENNGPDTVYQLRVKKYQAASSSWTTLGDLIVTSNTRDFALAVDKYKNPMLFYQNDTKTPVFLPFDSDVNNWGAPVVFTDADASSLNIEVAPNGISFASYIVNEKINLYKFDSPDNE